MRVSSKVPDAFMVSWGFKRRPNDHTFTAPADQSCTRCRSLGQPCMNDPFIILDMKGFFGRTPCDGCDAAVEWCSKNKTYRDVDILPEYFGRKKQHRALEQYNRETRRRNERAARKAAKRAAKEQARAEREKELAALEAGHARKKQKKAAREEDNSAKDKEVLVQINTALGSLASNVGVISARVDLLKNSVDRLNRRVQDQTRVLETMVEKVEIRDKSAQHKLDNLTREVRGYVEKCDIAQKTLHQIAENKASGKRRDRKRKSDVLDDTLQPDNSYEDIKRTVMNRERSSFRFNFENDEEKPEGESSEETKVSAQSNGVATDDRENNAEKENKQPRTMVFTAYHIDSEDSDSASVSGEPNGLATDDKENDAEKENKLPRTVVVTAYHIDSEDSDSASESGESSDSSVSLGSDSDKSDDTNKSGSDEGSSSSVNPVSEDEALEDAVDEPMDMEPPKSRFILLSETPEPRDSDAANTTNATQNTATSVDNAAASANTKVNSTESVISTTTAATVPAAAPAEEGRQGSVAQFFPK